MADPRVKTLKIKTGVVKRLTKEKVMYEQEVEKQKERIQKLKEEGNDEHVIRKQEEVLQESVMMIPDCQRRLLKAFDELKTIIDTESDLKEIEDYEVAQKILNDAKPQLPTIMYPPPVLPETSIPWITPPPFPPPTYFNVPPPPFSIPPPTWSQPVSSTYLQSNLPTVTPPNHDEVWLNAWLSRRIIPTSVKRTLPLQKELKVFETKEAIHKCVRILKQLEESHQKLFTCKEIIMNADWQTKVDVIHANKAELSRYLEMLSSPQVLEKLKWALRKRGKKRKSQKRRKTMWQEHKAVITAERNLRQQAIDKWLEDMQQSAETTKLEESLKIEADAVLSDVTYKKSEARRQLAMLSALQKLRLLRTQVASAHGEQVSLELSECFSSVIEKLKSLWNDKLEEHSLEEKRLRVLLTEAVDERKVSYDKTVLAQWAKLLFGSIANVHPFYLTAESSLENFIAVRHSWDKCLATIGAAMSSSIPVGWVLPTNPSSVEWESVLTAETID